MRSFKTFHRAAAVLLLVSLASIHASAQDADPTTRQAIVTDIQAAKVPTLRPYIPSSFERTITMVQDTLLVDATKWHPFFQNSYTGGGFSPGVGYRQFVSPYSSIDVRGSVSI